MKDRFGRNIDYLRISVTDNCNLRCIYCMKEKNNKFLKLEEKLTDDEIYKIVYEFSKLGIKKIRITGGEPLVRKNILNLIENLNNINGIEEIYITTNGILLLDYVEILAKNGVKGVNISLDSLKDYKFKDITRGGDLNKVLKAIDKCIECGIKVKLNTVIIDEINKDEVLDFIALTIKKPIDVRFIELMPIGEGKNFKPITNREILDIIKKKYIDLKEIKREGSSGPAKYIKVNNSLGKIGFISAMSNCFCSECNRIRITSDGFFRLLLLL